MIRRELNYIIPAFIGSLLSSIMMVLLKNLKDIQQVNHSLIINIIIILFVSLVTGLGSGYLFERQFTNDELR